MNWRMHRNRDLSTVLWLVLAAAWAVFPQANATDSITNLASNNVLVLQPERLSSLSGAQQGDVQQALTTYNTFWGEGLAMRLKPSQRGYEGLLEFALPADISADQIFALELKVNARSSQKGWHFAADSSEGKSIPLGTAFTTSTNWQTRVAHIPGDPHTYIRGGQLAIRVFGPGKAEPLELDYAHLAVHMKDTASRKRAWTFMIYMAGDSNLEEGVVEDIEHEYSLTNADVATVALADRTPAFDKQRGNWTEGLLFVPRPGMKATRPQAIANWGEVNTGDPSTLVHFVETAKQLAPAEHYALVFWGHGYGWHADKTMEDETNSDSLQPHELAAALKVIGKLDVIAFDSCLMAGAEVLTIFAPHTSFFVASEEMVEMANLELESVLPKIQRNPTLGAKEVALLMGRSMRDYTASVIDVGQPLLHFYGALDTWVQKLLPQVRTQRRQLAAARKATGHFDGYTTYDLGSAIRQIDKRLSEPELHQASLDLIAAMDRAIIYNWHQNDKAYRDKAYGLSIFWPATTAELDRATGSSGNFAYYRTMLPFAELSHWDEFLREYTGFRQ